MHRHEGSEELTSSWVTVVGCLEEGHWSSTLKGEEALHKGR